MLKIYWLAPAAEKADTAIIAIMAVAAMAQTLK
jgi:hypothetical protein